MNYKKLGNTNIEVSAICLGTMTWGEQNNQKDAFEQMNYALEHGVNFFDTAEIYPSPCFENTYGSTEKIIGNWFKEKKNRDQVILASKFLVLAYHGYVVVVRNTQNKILKKLWKIA